MLVELDSVVGYCVVVGFIGGDQCGTWCLVYCSFVIINCVGEVVLYGSDAECLVVCGAFLVDGLLGD